MRHLRESRNEPGSARFGKLREHGNERSSTTFGKLTAAFIVFGMIPLFLVGIAIFINYYNQMSSVMISNYSQITDYFDRNVEDLIDSADSLMEGLYDYEAEEGTLTDVIKDDALEESERDLYMTQMLREMISQGNSISSLRFVDREGRVYSFFYDQNKTLRNDAEEYNQLLSSAEAGTDLLISATIEESLVCVNTEDYIFTLTRNFMDTDRVQTIGTEVLGTFYIDVNVEEIAGMADEADVGEGDFYLYLADSGEYLYSPREEDYQGDSDSLGPYQSLIAGEEGNENANGHWMFYEQVGDTDLYAVLLLDEDAIRNRALGNTTVLLLILCFVAFLLLGLYMFFSRRISQPVEKLKYAMEQVQKGDLSVRVETNTKDELKYISDGFNQMVEDLQHYIDEVYVAQITQKEAELNALKMQIQPHYLYNTLDIIRMTALENGDEETANLLESLAYQFRYLLGSQSDRSTIRDEVKLLQEYFVIIDTRYQGRISLTVNVSDEDAGLYVPKMLFQPIVENSVKHGLREKKGKGRVMVSVKRKGEILQVAIMDDGVGMSAERVAKMQKALEDPRIGHVEPDSGVSVGTKNVYDRVKLSCGEEYGFTVDSVEGMGTIVTFTLPVWETEDAGKDRPEAGASAPGKVKEAVKQENSGQAPKKEPTLSTDEAKKSEKSE